MKNEAPLVEPSDALVPPRRNPPLPVWIAVVIVCTAALWGGNPVAAKYSLFSETTGIGLPPITVSGIRFLLATLFMVFWCRMVRSPLSITRKQLPACLIAGTLLAAQIGTFSYGVHLSNSTHTTILINTFIIWILVFEHFISRHHRMTTPQIIGCILAAASALITILLRDKLSSPSTGTHDLPSLFGDCIMILSALLLAAKILFIKSQLTKIDPGTLMLWHDLIGVVWFVMIALLLERDQVSVQQVDAEVVVGLLYQGVIVGGLCFAVQTVLLKTYSATQISVFSFLSPVFGITAAALFRSDPLSSWIFLSLGLVAAGIYLVNRQGPRYNKSNGTDAE
ncbi:MAG: DMT family transporter [Planctomycetota bacterium]|nr:DMT family transporter [Planctomycetota bacterium]